MAMTDKERHEIFDYFKPNRKSKCFDDKLSYGRSGEIAAMNILQYNYNNDTFIDATKLYKPYDIVWYSKGHLIGVIDIKRQTSLKNNNVIIELSDVNNYCQIGW